MNMYTSRPSVEINYGWKNSATKCLKNGLKIFKDITFYLWGYSRTTIKNSTNIYIIDLHLRLFDSEAML